MLILWCSFLLLTHFLCHVHPQKCDFKYEYIDRKTIQCCLKCKPGELMVKRCTAVVQTMCKECNHGYFMDEYSNEMECKKCTQCNKAVDMVYKVNCSKSSDAVCDCKSGYKCVGNPCTDCVKIPTTVPTPPPPLPTTTTMTKTSTVVPNIKNDEQQTITSQDTVWITMSLCCVCILLTCFILISRRTPPCGWIMLASAGSVWGSKKTSAESSQCTDDEEVPMPVQEMCGQKEWQEEV